VALYLGANSQEAAVISDSWLLVANFFIRNISIHIAWFFVLGWFTEKDG
jgi:hypothetical protein